MVRIANGRSNMANASARAKARKASLIDSTPVSYTHLTLPTIYSV